MVKLILKMLADFFDIPVLVQPTYEQSGCPGKIGAIHGLHKYGHPFIKATMITAAAKSPVYKQEGPTLRCHALR